VVLAVDVGASFLDFFPVVGDSSASSFESDVLASVGFASSVVDDVVDGSVLAALASSFESVDFDSVDDDLVESDWPSSAEATAAPLAIATPIPRATANPPTLPMNLPYPSGVDATGRFLSPGGG
jgi:hypothetical protein